MKKFIFLISGILLVTAAGLFYYGVYERYMDAIGQRRAISLATTLQQYYHENKALPSTLVEDINQTGCLSDGRGNPIFIDGISKDSFSIRYAPDEDHVLTIKWDQGMEEMLIDSSIKKP